MFALSRRTSASFQVLTPLHPLMIHFADRSFICGRVDCPMCEFERARQRFYLMARHQSDSGLLEIPPTLAREINDRGKHFAIGSPVGLCLWVARPSKRSPWKIEHVKHNPCPAADEAELVDEAELLFRIPPDVCCITWPAFEQRAALAHAPLLARAILPFRDAVASA